MPAFPQIPTCQPKCQRHLPIAIENYHLRIQLLVSAMQIAVVFITVQVFSIAVQVAHLISIHRHHHNIPVMHLIVLGVVTTR